MATRPTATWRRLDRPDAFLRHVDQALDAFEAELSTMDAPSDAQTFASIEHVVVALNEIDGQYGVDFDTIDREELCDYIDQALTEAGIDVEALAHRRGIDPAALTDQWRDW